MKAWADLQIAEAYTYMVDNIPLIYWLTLQRLLVLTKEASKENIEKYHLKPDGIKLFNHLLFPGMWIMEEHRLHSVC